MRGGGDGCVKVKLRITKPARRARAGAKLSLAIMNEQLDEQDENEHNVDQLISWMEQD